VEDLYFPVDEVMPKAKAAARKALEIDDNIAESHVEMGAIDTMYGFDWAGAPRTWIRCRRKSVSRSVGGCTLRAGTTRPSNSSANVSIWIQIILIVIGFWQGRFSGALTAEAKALKIDPAWSWAAGESARAYALSGRHAEAQRGLDDVLELSKRSHVSNYLLAQSMPRWETRTTLWTGWSRPIPSGRFTSIF
jgi:tetratricopeptide (TPR) repeat protein